MASTEIYMSTLLQPWPKVSAEADILFVHHHHIVENNHKLTKAMKYHHEFQRLLLAAQASSDIFTCINRKTMISALKISVKSLLLKFTANDGVASAVLFPLALPPVLME